MIRPLRPRRTTALLRLRAIAMLCGLAAVAACGSATDYPPSWAPLQPSARAAGPRVDSTALPICPDLRGTYVLSDPVITGNLVTRHLTPEQRAGGWLSVTIDAAGDDSLALRLERGTQSETIRLSRATAFTCADGWLTGPWPEHLFRDVADDGLDPDRSHTRQLWLTRDRDGRLVGREDIVSYRTVTVFCFDGCHGMRVPGTTREQTRWHRLSTPRTASADATPEPIGDPAINDRVARENAALEAGTPLPPR